MLPTEIKLNKFKPAVIEFNYAELEQSIEVYLEKYKGLAVTQETLADDKKLAQEMGSHVRKLNRLRIDKKKELSAPIADFENKIKSLALSFEEIQGEINKQVKVFEEKTLEKIKGLLEEYLAGEYKKQEVSKEFQRSTVEQQIKLSSLTKAGNLTAGARNSVEALVAADKAQQQTIELRLAQLEATCYKKGLAAPLTKSHVEHFLWADNEEYSEKLEWLIEAEIEREKQAAAAHRAKIEAEAEVRAKIEAENQERLEQETKELESLEAEKTKVEKGVENEALVEKNGKKVFTVTATFGIKAREGLSKDTVLNVVKKRILEAGFTTLANIKIED